MMESENFYIISSPKRLGVSKAAAASKGILLYVYIMIPSSREVVNQYVFLETKIFYQKCENCDSMGKMFHPKNKQTKMIKYLGLHAKLLFNFWSYSRFVINTVVHDLYTISPPAKSDHKKKVTCA